jgi:hypothetical protein
MLAKLAKLAIAMKLVMLVMLTLWSWAFYSSSLSI